MQSSKLFEDLIFLLACSGPADKMHRACEQKDQILKKIRTLHLPKWSLFLSKNYCDFGASSIGILVFEGTFGSI